MILTDIYLLFIIIYILIWTAVLIGILLLRREYQFAIKSRNWIKQKRIVQFKYPPFNILLKLWIRKKYLLTSTFFIIIIMFASVMYFVVGILLLTPIISIYQGFVAGILIGSLRKKDLLWAVTVGVFEFGYWALSGALGLSVILKFIFTDISFYSSLFVCYEKFLSFYWLPLAACIIINAFGETAGPIYLKIHGPISLEDLKGGKEN